MFVQKIAKKVKSLLPSLPWLSPASSHPLPTGPVQQLKVSSSPHIDKYQYKPTPYLPHHILQSAYQLLSPQINLDPPFSRQYLHFDDGGHITLDWSNPELAEQGKPIIIIMHGMTGGSQTKYIRVLVQKARQLGYCSVCVNSRGINSQMSSPIPFIGLEFYEFKLAIQRIRLRYPSNSLYVIGNSLGGNYVLRFLLGHPEVRVKGLVLISPPFDVKYVINGMNKIYQKLFIYYYMNHTVLKHDQMKFWWESGIVDLELLKKSKNLRQFHSRITMQIMGYDSSDQLFDSFKIPQKLIQQFSTKTLILTAKDDPMVGFQSFPIDSLSKNKNIRFIVTESGGHLCWFQGFKPTRWYPKPVFDFIQQLEEESQSECTNKQKQKQNEGE